MSKKNLSLISFITGIILIIFVLFIIVLFPQLEVTAVIKNVVLTVLMIPWVIFLFSLIFSKEKKEK